jgi:hypothetical protein
LVKPNYSYEKRQKELAKERKKQEKLQRKANKPDSTDAPGEDHGSAAPPNSVPSGSAKPSTES